MKTINLYKKKKIDEWVRAQWLDIFVIRKYNNRNFDELRLLTFFPKKKIKRASEANVVFFFFFFMWCGFFFFFLW